jgi:exopolysaccharide production protein ExoY
MFRSNEEYIDGGTPAFQRGAADSVEHPRFALGAKRLIDILAALTFFSLFLPLLVAVAVGVRLSSKGPILYTQDRVGLKGRTFRFYKFRSMVENSEEVFNSFLDSDSEARSQWEKYQKLDRDPRITRFGHFIRRTSLDELPQFWNVLTGDMSLVGPRPCMPSQRQLYGIHWKSYCAVRPGLTGLWQVSGRNELTYDQRVLLDAKYIENWSIRLDLKLLLKTVRVVLIAQGSR